MSIKVKSNFQKPTPLEQLADQQQQTNKREVAEVRKVIAVQKKQGDDMTADELRTALEKKEAALAVIQEKFVDGRHYMQPTEAMSPFLTQEGAALIASATRVEVFYTKDTEALINDNYYSAEYRVELRWKGQTFISQTGHANSKEADMRKQYEELKGDQWVPKTGKSVYDTIHNVQAKAKKRALVTAVRIGFGLSGKFGEEHDNPLASSALQKSVYTTFYKYALPYAPTAPTKLKNLKTGKFKQLTEKERLEWQKENLRATILQPNLLKEGFNTHNWGVKDIEAIKEKIANWIKEFAEKGNHETRN